MAISGTLLCIHRNPTQLSFLQDSGYALLTAANGGEGLLLFMSQQVDAVVLEYHAELVDGAFIAGKLKKTRPAVPIVVLADSLDLAHGVLQSVDALVDKSDGDPFLLATVDFVLNAKPAQIRDLKLTAQMGRSGRRREQRLDTVGRPSSTVHLLPTAEKYAPFSKRMWNNIFNGTVQF